MVGGTTHNRMLSEKTESVKSLYIHIHTYINTGIFIYNSFYLFFYLDREKEMKRERKIYTPKFLQDYS